LPKKDEEIRLTEGDEVEVEEKALRTASDECLTVRGIVPKLSMKQIEKME
jgi:hypothetical protein